ncbi:MAG TPA: hypothetical protein VF018_15710 [Acidobacteriaceae bacterium]
MIPIGLVLAAIVSLFARFHAPGQGFLAFYEDDFFYYARIAQRIAAGSHSTYSGAYMTNGYHPLWMLVIVALMRLFGTGIGFFYALQCLLVICVLVTYILCERTLVTIAPRSAWLPQFAAAALATAELVLASGGMEVALAVPLIAALVYYRLCRFTWTFSRAFVLGLLCAAVVLARLDAAILVASMAVFDLLWSSGAPPRQRLRCAIAFLGGVMPVALYLVLNEHWFHTLMPVSGEAKQMRFHRWPSPMFFSRPAFSPPERLFLVFPCLLATIAGIVILVCCPERRSRVRGAIPCLLALLLFPLLFVVALSVLSDWPIWSWYAYPLVASGIGGAALLLASEPPSPRIVHGLRWPALALLLLAWSAVGLSNWRNATRPDKVGYSIYLEAVDIARFDRTHPGVYAMGDRAGTPGFLLHEPLIQLEGLVMDKAFLADIRKQRPLEEVLREYGVRYYIATNPVESHGCWLTAEPLVAGPDAPHMRGTFCTQPLAEYPHSGFNTVIFDLAGGPAPAP